MPLPIGRLRNINESEMHPFLENGSEPIVLAHRGYASTHPENTMAAFGAAIDAGIRCIETDVQAASDGKVVVFHDDLLQRLTAHPGSVIDLTSVELKQLRVNGLEPLPLLEEALIEWPEIRFNIDAKNDHVMTPLLDLLAKLERLGPSLHRLFLGTAAELA